MNMAFAGVAIAALAGLTPRQYVRPTRGACYVTEILVVWDSVADYRIQRVLTAGIRRVEARQPAKNQSCYPTDENVFSLMRHATDAQLDSSTLHLPTIASHVQLANESVDVIQNTVRDLAHRAAARANGFRYIELVQQPGRANLGEEVTLPRLTSDSSRFAACEEDNRARERAHAPTRWAC